MAMTRRNAKSRREAGAFIPIPVSVLDHPNFLKLSAKAKSLLLDLCTQVRFKEGGSINNGDLTAAFSIMKERGWTSHESLQFAIEELLYYGFVTITRMGGRKICHLYAITWWAIDDCKGKLDVSETKVAPNNWKETKKKWIRPKRKNNSLPRSCTESGPYNGVMQSKGTNIHAM